MVGLFLFSLSQQEGYSAYQSLDLSEVTQKYDIPTKIVKDNNDIFQISFLQILMTSF